MKYIFLLFTFCFYKTNAQINIAHKQDTLRWFVGHWVDKKTFKIDSTINGKGGGGGTATVKANGTLDISTPESKDLDRRFNEAIKAIDDKEKAITLAIKEEEGMYQFTLANKSKKELEKIKEDYKELVSKINVTPPPPSPNDDLASALAKKCTAFAPEYHRIIDFYKAHKKDKHPHFDLPAPPVADYFNCWGCDTAKQIEFDTLSNRYVRDFFKDLRKDVNFLLAQTQTMEAMGIGGTVSRDVIDPVLKDAFDSTKSHHGACSYISYYDMSMALDFYLNRGMQMVDQLWKDNRKNYGAIVPVMKICLASYQQHAAFAGSTAEAEVDQIKTLAAPMEDLYDTLTNLLFKQKDYKLIGSIPFMIRLQSDILILTGGGVNENGSLFFGDRYSPKYDLNALLGFPRFELTVELETKIGEKGNYTITHLKSKSKVIAELNDKECVKFTLAKKEEEKIKADLITNEAIAPGPHGVYVGTKTYTSQSPIFKIRFCKIDGVPEGDSLYLSTFVPLAPDKGNWNVQGKLAPLGINSADRLFINIDQLKNDAENIKPEIDQKQLEEIKKKALEMAAKMNAMKAKGNFDPLKMGEMVKQMMNNTHSIVETNTSQLMRIKLPLKVTNMDAMVINQRFDAREINPSIAQPIVYAYLTIKLTHTPTNSGD